MTDEMSPSERPWRADPVSLDRFLDGELPPRAEARARAKVEADPSVAQCVERRGAFLDRLARAGRAWRTRLPAEVPPDLEAQIRRTLARPRRRRGRAALAYAAAAVVLVGVGFLAFPSHSPQSEAMPVEVLAARDALATGTGVGGCRDAGPTSPFAFPPVREGELAVLGCESKGTGAGRVRARLRGRAKTLGFVAVPGKGVRRGPEVGKTILGDVVVYDILYGEARAFLAVRRDFVEARGDCAACHNRSREGRPNPHFIQLRTWTLR